MFDALDIDQYLLSALNHQLPGYQWFFYAITQLGSPLALTLLASAVFLLGRNRTRVFAVVLVTGLLFGIVLLDDAKDIVQRPRPEGAYGMHFLIRNDYSFPSGHALAIFLFATVLGAYFGWKYYIAGYAMALAVSLSRLYLGVHYPSDVLAGALLGIALGELLVFAAYRLRLCDNYGPLSLIFKKPITPFSYDTGAFDRHWPLTAIVFLAITVSVLLYYINDNPLAVVVLAVAPSIILLYVCRSDMRIKRNMIIAFAFVTIGLISALSLFSLGSYALSLIAIAITYATVIALTFIKENQNDKMAVG